MSILEFVNPQAFWWALLAVPIVALYILKVRLRRKPISTLLFWDQLFYEKKQRSWWQQLRHLLSLLLQLAFLLLLVAALVDPLWSWQKKQQRRVVLIVDNSASMQASDEQGHTRLDAARQAARSLVRGMRDRDEMAILAAGGRVQVALGLTNHQPTLLETINSLPSTDSPTHLEQALITARQLLAGSEHVQEILVLTDGCTRISESLENDPQITFYGIGQPQDNIALTSLQTRRSLTDVTGYQILLAVTNHGEQETQVRVELTLNDQIVDVLPLSLAAQETKREVLDHISTEGGVLTATLVTEDRFVIDNTARAILPGCRPIPVVLVTPGNLFLQQVLASIPLVELSVMEELPGELTSQSIVVFDRLVPEKIEHARVLIVDPQNSCELFTVGETLTTPLIAKVEPEELTRHVHLENVLFPGAKALEFTGEPKVLISDAQDAPLLAILETPTSRSVVLTCGLSDGELPLRIAFPVLMKNAIEWFQGQSGQLCTAMKTGEIIPVDLGGLSLSLAASGQETKEEESASATASSPQAPPTLTAAEEVQLTALNKAEHSNNREWNLIAPDGTITSFVSRDHEAFIGPFQRTGIWTVVPPAADVKQQTSQNSQVTPDPMTNNESSFLMIACNLADHDESNLRPEWELKPFVEQNGAAWGGRSFWFYLTLMGLGLTCTEWWLYQRRIVG